MKHKPVIWIFIDWFLPAYKGGGPIVSVANIVENLHQDFYFKIVTSDRDLGDKQAFQNITVNQWIDKDDYSIIYLSKENRKQKIRAIIQEMAFDKIYLNSLFSVDFTLVPLIEARKNQFTSKVIIAPRGMLGKGALSIKPLKKKVFLKLAKITGMFNGVTWHATTKDETDSIVKYFGKNQTIVTIQNLTRKIPENAPFLKKDKGSLKLVFFARISLKKNLHYALEILQQFDKKGIVFDIYGSIEDPDYWRKIQQKISTIKNITINYKGEIHPQKVLSVLSHYHFLFLPTLHENFGHSIAEALMAGCGLIISDQTPWRNLLHHGVGWDISLNNSKGFIQAIENAYNMQQDDFLKLRENCIKFVKQQADNSLKVSLYKKLFSGAES